MSALTLREIGQADADVAAVDNNTKHKQSLHHTSGIILLTSSCSMYLAIVSGRAIVFQRQNKSL